MQTSRRSFLSRAAAGLGLAGSGSLLVPAAQAAESGAAFDEIYDIVVVGSGISGTMAALVAARSGAKTLLIEKLNRLGGTSRYSALDFSCVGSDRQKAEGIEDTPEAMVDDMSKVAGGLADRERALNVARNTARAQKVMADHGVKWKNLLKLGGHSAKRCLIAEGGGAGILRSLWASFERYPNLTVMPSTKLDELSLDETGVTGVVVRTHYLFDASLASDDRDNKSGAVKRFGARQGVIMATGGYARNYKMIEALQPWNLRIVGRTGAMPGARGDGIRACLWAGAKMDETHSMMMFDRCAIRPDQKPGRETIESGDSGFFWMGSQPWLKLDSDGKRFMNESGTYENVLHSNEYHKDHAHYTLFDSNWVKYAEAFKMHGCSRMFPFENGAEPNIPWQVVEQKMLPELVEKGYVKKADTLEDLAHALGLPVDAVEASVNRHNELYAKGEDVDFGKEKHRLSAIDKPPFYGAKNVGWMLCTMDGIHINTDLNAMDPDGKPIPGLYVIGNDSGCYFANEYPNLATGMACGRTVTFGRIVGLKLARS